MIMNGKLALLISTTEMIVIDLTADNNVNKLAWQVYLFDL